jgi:hypothetical protein
MRNSYVMTNDARAAELRLADLMRLGPLLVSTLRGPEEKAWLCDFIGGICKTACSLIQNINSVPEGNDGEEVRKRKRARGTGTVSSLCLYSVSGDPVGCHER